MVKMIDNLDYWIQSTLPAVYEDDLSMYELVTKTVEKLNELIDQSNVYFGQDLTAAVTTILTDWQTSGQLADIINQALFDGKLDKTEFETYKTTITQQLTDAANETDTKLSDFETTVNNNVSKKAYKVYGTPEEYGAVGDGVTDDTVAIQQCLNENVVTGLSGKSYLITTTLSLPETHSIEGNHAELIVKDTWHPSNIGASVPGATLIYVTHRGGVYGDELNQNTRFIRNVRLRANTNNLFVGLYLGIPDRSLFSDATTVNKSVFGMLFDNIGISYVDKGLVISEAWECNFTNLITSHITSMACQIAGQSVNNTFVGCKFATASEGDYGLYADAGTYAGGAIKRAEGCMFIGGFIGEAGIGVRIENALAFKFQGCIIDLTTINAVVGTSFDDVTFDSCYLYCTSVVVALSGIYTNQNNTFLVFKNCNVYCNAIGDSVYSVYVNQNQNGILFDGCMMSKRAFFSDGASGTITNCMWNEDESIGSRLEKRGTGILKSINNTWKWSGNDLPAITTVV